MSATLRSAGVVVIRHPAVECAVGRFKFDHAEGGGVSDKSIHDRPTQGILAVAGQTEIARMAGHAMLGVDRAVGVEGCNGEIVVCDGYCARGGVARRREGVCGKNRKRRKRQRNDQ